NIELENDEFSIKRSDRMGNLMSVRTAKIMDENAQGYLSVKDIYLADKTVWMSQIKNKIETFSGPNSSTCGTENLGSARISNSGEVFVCLGSKGWKIIKS
ncbi:MAG: hypothetical protein HAW58_05595, partial [Candidatus Thioglobus sp.]|nr:hypothetical protein [Candidatus Thioglobus sp.]